MKRKRTKNSNRKITIPSEMPPVFKKCIGQGLKCCSLNKNAQLLSPNVIRVNLADRDRRKYKNLNQSQDLDPSLKNHNN